MNAILPAWRAVRRNRGLYLFIIPSLLLVVGFAYLPAFSAVYHSFYEWSGGTEKRFVGAENFARAFRDPVFRQSFVTIAILMGANILKLIPSIFVAVLIHRLKSERWQYWYRILVVTPMVVPAWWCSSSGKASTIPTPGP
jgi:ABC-type sugar transport system permease subunit